MFNKKHQTKRSSNILFVIFRLCLSFVMFAVLLAGIYTAYKHFSGLDPLKLDPQSLVSNLILSKTPPEVGELLSKLKINSNILGKSVQSPKQGTTENPQIAEEPAPNSNLAFRFLLVADSHSDNTDLQKALAQAKNKFPDLKFIIGLGDYTEVGTVEELKKAKKEFDATGLRYFLIPGDHDLWDCRNRNIIPVDCFKEVFGPNYQAFTFDNFEFVLLDNSDNYQGLGEEQLQWLTQELDKAKEAGVKEILVFMHEPLYHPSSDHIMGEVDKSLKAQAQMLLFQLNAAGVKQVFAGNIHFFSQYQEPKTNLKMITIGAASLERNPQVPRYGIGEVLDNGEVRVEDVEIK